MKVSVIIPVYNVEKYVKECVESVMNQTLKDIEIICIHDAGTDDSWDIVKKLQKEDDRIVLLENEENVGLAATRNVGMDKAMGKYIYFLDSDDMIKKDALEILCKRADEENLDVQIFGADFIYENKDLELKFRTNPRIFKGAYEDVIDGKSLFIKWMDIWDWMPSQPRFFYNRQFLADNNLRYKNQMLHEDEVFTFDVLQVAQRIRVTQDEFFIRRFRESSIMTGGPTIKNVEGCIKIIDRAISAVSNEEASEDYNKAVKFYVYKIFKDATKKYRLAKKKLDENNAKIILSEDIKNNESRLAIFHLIESFGLWEEV